jgi:hypothetical protein
MTVIICASMNQLMNILARVQLTSLVVASGASTSKLLDLNTVRGIPFTTLMALEIQLKMRLVKCCVQDVVTRLLLLRMAFNQIHGVNMKRTLQVLVPLEYVKQVNVTISVEVEDNDRTPLDVLRQRARAAAINKINCEELEDVVKNAPNQTSFNFGWNDFELIGL